MKLCKVICATILVVALCVSAVTSIFADSIYYADGCYYTYINNDKVSVTGWDNEVSTVVKPPDTINGRVVASISKRAFTNDSVITGVDFSDAKHLELIDNYAFARCASLTESLLIPENISEIGDCAFEASSVREVIINASLEYIPIQCFYSCKSLITVEINGTQEIDSYAFADCPNLSKVIIWDSVTKISDTAFDNDPNLKIYGFADSYAQTYALEHDIPFVEMVRFMLGDVDGIDGVNISDATAVQSYLAELRTLEGIYLLAADANQDGDVDITDATAIQMKVADYELPYPIGQYITQEIVSE